MTYRQILAALRVGETHEFQTIEQARSAGSSTSKFYNGMRFSRVGRFFTRIA